MEIQLSTEYSMSILEGEGSAVSLEKTNSSILLTRRWSVCLLDGRRGV